MATATVRKPAKSESVSLVEYVSNRGATLRIDREKGVIYGVKILGLESLNGRSYSAEGVKAAAHLYEGAKVNVNHPPKNNPNAPREYGDRMGALENVTFNNGLFADYHFNPKHALAEQLLWDAEHAPHNVGFSHNIDGRVAKNKVNGKTVIESILSVTSVDLVADPATTRGLFESINPTTEGTIMDPALITLEHLAERQDLSQAVIRQYMEGEDVKKQSAELRTLREGKEAADKVLSENKTLREELDQYKAKEALAVKRAEVDKAILEAKLPVSDKAVVSETFIETLMAATDSATVTKLIEDRKGLIKVAAKITSRGPDGFVESYGGIKDTKDFAMALRR